jgi:uncharacterized membrane protein
VLAGKGLYALALLRLVAFDFLLFNPLWSGERVGETPFFNALLLLYGVPIFWVWQAARHMQRAKAAAPASFAYGLVLLLVFVLLSLNVRQLFGGALLVVDTITTAEIYTYSAVWLGFGIALLFLGTLRKDKSLRAASLVVMVLTIGKVFLLDAAALEPVAFRLTWQCQDQQKRKNRLYLIE